MILAARHPSFSRAGGLSGLQSFCNYVAPAEDVSRQAQPFDGYIVLFYFI